MVSEFLDIIEGVRNEGTFCVRALYLRMIVMFSVIMTQGHVVFLLFFYRIAQTLEDRFGLRTKNTEERIVFLESIISNLGNQVARLEVALDWIKESLRPARRMDAQPLE